MSSSKADELDKPSTQRAPQQPVGGVGRAPAEHSHQRDDQTVVRSSNGERDHVKSSKSEACAGGALTRTRQQCVCVTQLEHREHDDSQQYRPHLETF